MTSSEYLHWEEVHRMYTRRNVSSSNTAVAAVVSNSNTCSEDMATWRQNRLWMAAVILLLPRGKWQATSDIQATHATASVKALNL